LSLTTTVAEQLGVYTISRGSAPGPRAELGAGLIVRLRRPLATSTHEEEIESSQFDSFAPRLAHSSTIPQADSDKGALFDRFLSFNVRTNPTHRSNRQSCRQERSTSILLASFSEALVSLPTATRNEDDILSGDFPISSKKNLVRVISRNWQEAQVFQNLCDSSAEDTVRQPGTREIDASPAYLKHSHIQRYIANDQFDPADSWPSLPDNKPEGRNSRSCGLAPEEAIANLGSQTRESQFSAAIHRSAADFRLSSISPLAAPAWVTGRF